MSSTLGCDELSNCVRKDKQNASYRDLDTVPHLAFAAAVSALHKVLREK